MNEEQRTLTALQSVSAFCAVLLAAGGCDDSASSPVGISNEAGYEIRRLTDASDDDWGPAWSPDGRSIAFTSNRDGNTEIYVMDASGGNARNLTNYNGKDGHLCKRCGCMLK